MPVLDRIFLLPCEVLCHLLTHLSQPNLPSLWTSYMWFLYLVWFFERPFCDESSVNTKCSIRRRNNAVWFSTESHFSFFHFSLCLPLSLLHYSTDPLIKWQRQKMLWLFPSSLCQWILLLTAQLTATNRNSIILCIMEFYLPGPQHKVGLLFSSSQFSQNTEISSLSELDELARR